MLSDPKKKDLIKYIHTHRYFYLFFGQGVH